MSVLTTALETEYVTFDQTTGAEMLVEKVFQIYDGNNLTCQEAEAPFKNLNAAQAIAKRATVTTNEPPGTRTDRNCSATPVGDVITNVQPDSNYGTDGNGFVADDDTPPASNNDGIPTETVFAISNPEVFAPVVEWQNGKARISNAATPNIGAGEHPYYFLSGQPPREALKTDYTYSPGDRESVMLAIATSPDPAVSSWIKKAYVSIDFGPAPTT